MKVQRTDWEKKTKLTNSKTASALEGNKKKTYEVKGLHKCGKANVTMKPSRLAEPRHTLASFVVRAGA